MAENLDVVTRTYDLLLWLLPQVARFPRSHRFTLGERLEKLGLDILELLISTWRANCCASSANCRNAAISPGRTTPSTCTNPRSG